MFLNQRGMHLTEIVMVMAIIGIIAIPSSRFFKKQTEASAMINAQLNYRAQAERFLTRFVNEFQQARKDSVFLYRAGGVQGLEGTRLVFEYDSFQWGITVKSTYSFTSNGIMRTSDRGNGSYSKMAIDKVGEIELDGNDEPAIFKKVNAPGDRFIETVMVSFTAHNRYLLTNRPEPGWEKYIFSVVVTARN